MAKPEWLTFAPSSGNGDTTVNASGTAHTGRVARTYTATGTATGVSTPVTINVTQTAKTEFVQFANEGTASIEKTGGTLTITGTSNTKTLTFSFLESPSLTLPAVTSYQVAGSAAESGVAIPGDPGATAEYTFTVQFTDIPENEEINPLTCTLVATAEGGQSAQCVITQAAGDPYLYVTEEGTTTVSVTIPTEGTPAQAIQILSNTDWTIA